jgi:hypothetical protein
MIADCDVMSKCMPLLVRKRGKNEGKRKREEQKEQTRERERKDEMNQWASDCTMNTTVAPSMNKDVRIQF